MYKTLLACSLLALWGCGKPAVSNQLPFLGEKTIVEKDGKIDSLPHRIGDFSFVNQKGETVTQKDVEGKVYVADFFFTSCPSICPRVKKEMKRIYEAYKQEPRFAMISHSIDTRFDTVGRLAWYGQKLGIEAPKWQLLTGNKDALYKIAYDYLLSALENPEAPGGFDHSGHIALIDGKRRIRGLYDGLDPKRVDDLIRDIAILLQNPD